MRLCFSPLVRDSKPITSLHCLFLYPGAKPALDPHHGERGAVGQGQLHLRRGE